MDKDRKIVPELLFFYVKCCGLSMRWIVSTDFDELLTNTITQNEQFNVEV